MIGCSKGQKLPSQSQQQQHSTFFNMQQPDCWQLQHCEDASKMTPASSTEQLILTQHHNLSSHGREEEEMKQTSYTTINMKLQSTNKKKIAWNCNQQAKEVRRNPLRYIQMKNEYADAKMWRNNETSLEITEMYTAFLAIFSEKNFQRFCLKLVKSLRILRICLNSRFSLAHTYARPCFFQFCEFVQRHPTYTLPSHVPWIFLISAC